MTYALLEQVIYQNSCLVVRRPQPQDSSHETTFVGALKVGASNEPKELNLLEPRSVGWSWPQTHGVHLPDRDEEDLRYEKGRGPETITDSWIDSPSWRPS